MLASVLQCGLVGRMRTAEYIVDDQVLQFVFSHRKLGAVVDRCLRFYAHVNVVVCRVDN